VNESQNPVFTDAELEASLQGLGAAELEQRLEFAPLLAGSLDGARGCRCLGLLQLQDPARPDLRQRCADADRVRGPDARRRLLGHRPDQRRRLLSRLPQPGDLRSGRPPRPAAPGSGGPGRRPAAPAGKAAHAAAWDLWNFRALFPDAGPAELAAVKREQAAILAREREALARLWSGDTDLLSPGRTYLAARPGLVTGITVSLHTGPYQLLAEPWLAAGLQPLILLNGSALPRFREAAFTLQRNLRHRAARAVGGRRRTGLHAGRGHGGARGPPGARLPGRQQR
jgi:hypothetical protein